MRKLLLICSFLFAVLTSYAQYYGDGSYPAVTFGLIGGSNFAYLRPTTPHRQYVTTDASNPFSLGLTADLRFNDFFSFRPAVFYAGKGGTLNPVYGDDYFNNVSVFEEYKLHYLEIPLNAIGHLPLASGADIFLGAGPFFSWGLNGVNKQTISTADPVTHKITYGSNGDFKRIDAGITSVFGFQTAGGASISGNLEFGVTNIMENNTTGFDATRLKTITFYLGIGQRF